MPSYIKMSEQVFFTQLHTLINKYIKIVSNNNRTNGARARARNQWVRLCARKKRKEKRVNKKEDSLIRREDPASDLGLSSATLLPELELDDGGVRSWRGTRSGEIRMHRRENQAERTRNKPMDARGGKTTRYYHENELTRLRYTFSARWSQPDWSSPPVRRRRRRCSVQPGNSCSSLSCPRVGKLRADLSLARVLRRRAKCIFPRELNAFSRETGVLAGGRDHLGVDLSEERSAARARAEKLGNFTANRKLFATRFFYFRICHAGSSQISKFQIKNLFRVPNVDLALLRTAFVWEQRVIGVKVVAIIRFLWLSKRIRYPIEECDFWELREN